MKSIIICEGGTDLALIQYFMEKVNNWEYKKNKDNNKEIKCFNQIKNFTKNDNKLSIASCGTCSKIPERFKDVIEKNIYSAYDDEKFDNIIIISDRDELQTVSNFENKLKHILSENDIDVESIHINNNEWINIKCLNGRHVEINFKILLLIIPFEETGALETFLLNSIAKNDSYDKKIIDQSNVFVDSIDEENRYLNKRRYKTKAKFDVYFSIRTPLEQFTERRNILKNIPWEEYEVIQSSFKKLRNI